MSPRRLTLPLSTATAVVAVILAAGPLAAAISPALDESAKDLAAVISVAPAPPNVNYLVGRALMQQNHPNLALGYLLQVPNTDADYGSAKALIKTIQNPVSKISGTVPTSASDAALLSISTAYEGYGWINLPLTQKKVAQSLGEVRLYEKGDQLLIAIPYRAGKLPPAKMGATVLSAIQPYVKSKVSEIHVVWFNKRFEMLEMVYSVDRRSRKFLPKTWLYNDAPVQIGYPSDAELRKLRKFVSNGF